jgi:hypothetical protein
MVGTVKDLCKANETVNDDSLLDRVESLQDFISSNIAPADFFANNHTTRGMQGLFDQGFERLAGKSGKCVFKLTQGMGGGKTHSVIAFGLLAASAETRLSIVPDSAFADAFGDADVVAIDGRENYPTYLWGYIAERLGKAADFEPFYRPVARAPSPNDWQKLIGDAPVVIAFDELPTYLDDCESTSIGSSNLARVTVRAIANLLVAVAALPKAMVIITDLTNTYQRGSALLSEALLNMEGEANRQAVDVSPVQLNTDEIYHILRKRIFAACPQPQSQEVEDVAEAYVDSLKRAKAMDVVVGTPESIKERIHASYPFHPSLRDIAARFRENPGYQQTRDLITLMRLITRAVLSPGRKDAPFLIGFQHADLNDPQTVNAVRRINDALSNAVATDVASNGGAKAEALDSASGHHVVVPAATLLLMSSLSTAANPVVGLTEPELTECLVTPGAKVEGVREALDALRSKANHLHRDRDGRWYFSPTENVQAKLNALASGYTADVVTRTLRDKLEAMFGPKERDLYQRVLPLPSADRIVPEQDSVLLVIVEPHQDGLNPIAQKVWDDAEYKNRLLFLTGDAGGMTDLNMAARELKAAEDVVKDIIDRQRLAEGSPQAVEARRLLEDKTSSFSTHVIETFKAVHYPQARGLRAVAVRMTFAANHYDGEEQIKKVLSDARKFRPKVDEEFDGLRTRIESDLFSAKRVPWVDVKRAAAMQQGFVMLPPRGLDHLRDQCVEVRKLWRAHPGGYVEKPPFPPDRTGVICRTRTRDETTGKTSLEVKAVHGDRVHWARNSSVSASSPIVVGEVLDTEEVSLWFLCVDTKHTVGTDGHHETGDPVRWSGKVEVKIDPQSGATSRRMVLSAVPPGAAIRFTLDDSEPASSGTAYTGPIDIGDGGCTFAAIAEKEGIRSEKVTYRFPPRTGIAGRPEVPQIDPNRPAKWKARLRFRTTEDTYNAVKAAKDAQATIIGLEINVTSKEDSDAFASLVLGEGLGMPASDMEGVLADLQARVPGGEVTLAAPAMSFETGNDLNGFSNAIGQAYDVKDVIQ